MATFVRGSEEEVEMVVQNIVNSVLLTNKYIFVMSDEEDPENRIIRTGIGLYGFGNSEKENKHFIYD